MMSLAAAMIMLGGIVHAVAGIVAIDEDAWAWGFIVYGCVQFIVALTVFLGSRVGQLVALVIALLDAVAQVDLIGRHPAWSVVIIAIDGVIVYAVLVHGRAFAQDKAMVDLFYSEARAGYADVQYVSDPQATRAAAEAATGRRRVT